MTVPASHQLPSGITAQEFGEVNIKRISPDQIQVSFTMLMKPEGVDAEGWQTGVAIDASASMKNWYGKELTGRIPPDLEQEYLAKGWLFERVEDGRKVRKARAEAHQDAIRLGHLRLTANIIEPEARKFVSYLADELDADGGTTVIYWACGKDGSQIEELGDYTGAECQKLGLTGPAKAGFGNGTRLLPAMNYFVERFRDAKQGMYVFLTDGSLEDLEEVKSRTIKLAREIEAKKRHPVKFVLVGMGDKIDEGQMEELDDLDTGTSVDIWDHKVARELRSVLEIFAELVSENQFVAGAAVVFDDAGNVVQRFERLPAKVSLTVPATCSFFELEVEGLRIHQKILLPK